MLISRKNNKQSRPYRIWAGMKTRCYNKNHKDYKYYGERGITVCKKWQTFDGFWEDMQEGYKDDLTIDKIDNNKGYFKENCRWVDRKVQGKNRRVVLAGSK